MVTVYPWGFFCHLIYTSFKKEGKRRSGERGRERREEKGWGHEVFFFLVFFNFLYIRSGWL